MEIWVLGDLDGPWFLVVQIVEELSTQSQSFFFFCLFSKEVATCHLCVYDNSEIGYSYTSGQQARYSSQSVRLGFCEGGCRSAMWNSVPSFCTANKKMAPSEG